MHLYNTCVLVQCIIKKTESTVTKKIQQKQIPLVKHVCTKLTVSRDEKYKLWLSIVVLLLSSVGEHFITSSHSI